MRARSFDMMDCVLQRALAVLVWGALGTAVAIPARAEVLVTANGGVERFDGSTFAPLAPTIAPGSGGLGVVTGVSVAPDGRLFVSSATTDVVAEFATADDSFVGDALGNPEGLRSPMGLRTGPNGNIFIANRFVNNVVELDTATGLVVSRFVGSLAVPVLTPEDVAFDGAGLLYVASASTNTIVRIDRTTGVATEFIGAAGGLNYPHGLAFSAAGALFVSDHFNNEVVEFDAAGGLVGPFAAVDLPAGLAFAVDGSLLVVSTAGGGSVEHFSASGVDLGALAVGARPAYVAVRDLPRITSLTRVLSTVVGGCQSTTVTVTLDGAAPAGGSLVTLRTTNAALQLPATVFIPEGSTSATMTATSSAVAADVVVGFTAQLGSSARNNSITVARIGLATGTAALTITPSTISGGQTATGTVAMFCAPILADAVVTLTSSAASIAAVPATVTVPTGSTTASFTVTTTSPTVSTTVTLSATFDRTQSRNVTVTQNTSVTSLSVSPTVVFGTQNATGTVVISTAAGAGGLVVSLASANPAVVTVPATVTVAQGATSATFTATTAQVIGQTGVLLTATFGASSRTRTLTVRPPGVSTNTLSPSSIRSAQTSTGTVRLEAVAPPGGVVVTLATQNAAVASPTVASITIPEGALTGTYTVLAATVAAASSTRITASANTTTKFARINVNP